MLIHFHGASVGEISCALKVIKSIRSNRGTENDYFLITYTSTSARDWLETCDLPTDVRTVRLSFVPFICFFVPKYRQVFDFIKSEKNRCLIILEKDRRPDVISLYKDGFPVINIEAKPPQSSLNKLFVYLSNQMSKIDLFCVENEKYAQEILQIVPSAKLHITGTLKAAAAASSSREERFLNEIGNFDKALISYVSLKVGEIPSIAKIINNTSDEIGGLFHVLIPRYVNKDIYRDGGKNSFDKHLKKNGVTAHYANSIEDLVHIVETEPQGTVVLLQYGVVEKVLSISNAAVVCGSFQKKGKGHNVFEPLLCGVPTFTGPYVRNWQYTIDQLLKEGLLQQSSSDGLSKNLLSLLAGNYQIEEMREKIRHSKYIQLNADSHNAIAMHILTYVAHWMENGHSYSDIGISKTKTNTSKSRR